MSPTPKVPIWGDSQRLAQLSSGLKLEGGTYGAVVQRNEPGRPTGTTGIPAPRAGGEVPAEYIQLANTLAQSDWARQQWDALAATSPSPYVMAMRDIAQADFDETAARFYSETPNFED